MTTVVLLIHIMIAAALVGVILIQRSEGGGLGLGSGTFGGLMTGRGSANLLTRTTAVLAGCFIGTSILLAILAGSYRTAPSIIDQPVQQPAAPAAPAAPPVPAPPTAPVAQ